MGFRIDKKGDPGRVVLSGDLTEETDLGPLIAESAPGALTLEVSGVSRINSNGVREWVRFVGELNARGTHIVLERCHPAVVAQLNMISNFVGKGGSVRSVLAPYHCTECDAERLEEIAIALIRDVNFDAPLVCPSCGAEMEFDDLPETYLEFAMARDA